MKKIVLCIVSAAAFLSACTVQPLEQPGQASTTAAPVEVRVTAVGYGAISTYQGYSAGQKRLLAMRASKLDAFRSLAEQVYGMRITGNSTVSQMAMKDDGFAARIDAYIRGARVLSVVAMEDGNYETTVELDYDSSVIAGFPQRAYANPPINDRAVGIMRGSAGPGGAYYTSSYYYAE